MSKQQFFCYYLNGFTLGNDDCNGCGRCKIGTATT